MAVIAIENIADFDQLIEAGKPVLIDFWAPWCGPCKMVAPEVEKVAEAYQEKVQVAKVNVDAVAGLAGKYKVMGIPTLLIFKDGQEVNRLVGFRPAAEITKALEGIV